MCANSGTHMREKPWDETIAVFVVMMMMPWTLLAAMLLTATVIVKPESFFLHVAHSPVVIILWSLYFLSVPSCGMVQVDEKKTQTNIIFEILAAYKRPGKVTKRRDHKL